MPEFVTLDQLIEALCHYRTKHPDSGIKIVWGAERLPEGDADPGDDGILWTNVTEVRYDDEDGSVVMEMA